MSLKRTLKQPKPTAAAAEASRATATATAAAANAKQHAFVAINFGDEACGQGLRYVVATRGRKWVHLFYIPTLTAFSVTPQAYAALRPRVADECKPTKLKRMLKDKRTQYDALNMLYSGEAADRAKASLKALA